MPLELSLLHPDGSSERMVWEDAVLGRLLRDEIQEDQLQRLTVWLTDRLADRGLAILEPDRPLLREGLLQYLHRAGDGSPIRLRVGPVPVATAEREVRRPDTRPLERALLDGTPVWVVYDNANAAVALLGQVAAGLDFQCHTWRMGAGFEAPLPGEREQPAAVQGPAPTLAPAMEAALNLVPQRPTLLSFLDLPTLPQYLDVNAPSAQLTRLVERVRNEPRLRLAVLRPEDEIPARWRHLFRLVRLRTSQSGTPTLDALADDLTAAARAGRLPPLVGRGDELERLLDVLNRAEGLPNSPLLVGPAGVGKTAIMEGLAQLVASGAVPSRFRGRRVMSLSVTALAANSQHIGELESQLRQLTAELEEHAHSLIVFVDEIHTLLRIGGPGAPAAQALKASLGRGAIALVGATTNTEVAVVDRDPAFSRRFSRIVVQEPNLKATLAIARRWRDRLEAFHGVSIADATVAIAVEEADWHVPDQHRPYSAIALMGDAASRAERLRGRTEVTGDDIFDALRFAVGMDVRWPGAEELARLAKIESDLNQAIVGQEEAIRDLLRQVRGRRFRRDRTSTPFAVLLVGPSGVGKTESALALGSQLFPGMAPITYHMEAYTQDHQAMDLIGAPPSYVGFDEGSRLVNDVRGRPRLTLIFDEIEKAHSRVAQVLMGILDRGEYLDPRGLRGDFRHAYFFFTSNVLTHPDVASLSQLEFERLLRERFAALGFAPEQVARFGKPIRFAPLDLQDRALVAERQLSSLAEEYQKAYGVELRCADGLAHNLAELAGDPALGVRPILRRIQDVRATVIDSLFAKPTLPTAIRIWLDTSGELLADRVV